MTKPKISGSGKSAMERPIDYFCRLPAKYRFIDDFAHKVADCHMTFLNLCGFRTRDDETKGTGGGEFRAPRAGEPHCGHPAGPRRFYRTKDISRLAACSQGDQQVARLTQSLNLSRKHVLKAEIIADRCQVGAVRCEGDGWQRDTVAAEPAYEFRGDMLGVTRAAAIAAKQELVSGEECGHHRLGDSRNLGPVARCQRGSKHGSRQQLFLNEIIYIHKLANSAFGVCRNREFFLIASHIKTAATTWDATTAMAIPTW